MLVASVLSVVASSPAQAANTSGEVLIDTNGDNVADRREFAGSHRYNTAVALANRFAADEGAVSSVVIASGETQVDAVTAAGLAGNLNAPVLLTRSTQLPHNVGRYIDEHNVTDVIVVGGTAAVPDAIVTALESLGSRPTVERISGSDRYATAAAVGSRLGGSATWCGSSQSAAILVNGGEAGRSDAVISGPVAFRLGLPILLTGADELPESTASFLTDNRIERVVIVGGMTSVSDGIVNDLVENVGVVNVQRISGGSAAATSVMVAKEMLGNCADVLGANEDLVALVNRDAIADGIAAAPVLGRGIGDVGSVPILLVGDDLPAAVSDYLGSTAEMSGGTKTHLGIVAVGGTAVVSNTVMADAVAAAKTSSMLTAEITPVTYTTTSLAAARTGAGTPATTDDEPCSLAGIPAGAGAGSYTCQFRVTFSDTVKLPVDANTDGALDAAERRGTVLDPTLYRLNGRRLQAYVASGGETGAVQDLIVTADRTVTISLSHHLDAGDTISVTGGTKIGADDDQRKLEEASLTLSAVTLAADRTAPVIEIVAPADRSSFTVYVTEPNILHSEIGTRIDGNNTPGSNFADFISIQRTGATLKPSSPDVYSSPGRKGSVTRYDVSVVDGSNAAATLAAGDVITIQRGAIIDKGGRRSALTRYTVTATKTNTAGSPNTNFEVQSVSIGDYVHGTQASADIVNASAAAMTVTARATGVASGARGNDWTIFGFDNRAYANGNAFSIRVAVDTAHQRISYTISDVQPQTPNPARPNGPTIGDLAAALVSNSDFNANFAVSYSTTSGALTGKNTALATPNPAGVDLTGGMSSVGVVVRFNAPVAQLTRFSTAPGNPIIGANDGGAILAYAIAPDMDPNLTALDDDDGLTVTHFSPDYLAHISYAADSMAKLPKRSGFRVIVAQSARTFNPSGTVSGVFSVRKILNSLRPDASIKP